MNSYRIPKSKLPELTLAGLFHSEFLNPIALITSLYGGDMPSYKRYRENFFKDKIIDYLNKNGGQLVQIGEEVLISKTIEELEQEEGEEPFMIGGEVILPSFDYEDGSIYFYKDNFIQINSESGRDKDKCKLMFYYPTSKQCVDEEFREFMDTDKRPNIFMVNQDYGNFNFSKFNINLPETFDLELNYGDDFKSVSDKMIKSLHENSSGLYMLHGIPGTGKTTYIRYLASVLKKDVIFFPTSFVDEITNPSILSLLKKKTDCVMILEDAEKALTKRSLSDQPSLVSTLLNMTDGILGDVLKLNVIVTYNCDRQDIDEALLRKGRLKAEYSFQGLKKHQAAKLIKTLDLDIKADDNMTLADIYYAKSDEELIGNIKTLEKPKIGFMP
jgi:hypothetical protein